MLPMMKWKDERRSTRPLVDVTRGFGDAEPDDEDDQKNDRQDKRGHRWLRTGALTQGRGLGARQGTVPALFRGRRESSVGGLE